MIFLYPSKFESIALIKLFTESSKYRMQSCMNVNTKLSELKDYLKF